MHVLLAIRDPQAAATGARALRKVGMTVDVAMNARVAVAMAADSSYDVVVFEQGFAPHTESHQRCAPVRSPAVLEISATEAADPDGLVIRVRAVADGR